VIVDALVAKMRSGQTEEMAIGDLEAWRGNDTLYKLSLRLKEKRENRVARGRKRKNVGGDG
jgi:hypothetical protein